MIGWIKQKFMIAAYAVWHAICSGRTLQIGMAFAMHYPPGPPGPPGPTLPTHLIMCIMLSLPCS